MKRNGNIGEASFCCIIQNVKETLVNKLINSDAWLTAMAEKVEAEGPQTIDVAGHGRLTLLTEQEFKRLSERRLPLKDWLLAGPRLDDVEFERDQRPSRDFSF